MKKIIEEKFKIRKWEWIPFFGTLAFIFRIEIWRKSLNDKNLSRQIGQFRSLWNLFFFVTSIVFLILFFTLRNTNGFGPFPWFFWLSLSLGIGNNLNVWIPLSLYKWGYKKYLEKQHQEKLN